MAKYSRTIEVDAYQIAFTDQEKDAAKKGIPTRAHGGYIRYDEGKYSVLVGQQHAFEGDWVVGSNGFLTIYSDENFKKDFTEVPEVVETPAEEAPDPVVVADEKPVDTGLPETPAVVATNLDEAPVATAAPVTPVDTADTHGVGFDKQEPQV